MSRRNITIEKLPDGASLYEGIGVKKMPEEMDELLTVREVARRLRVDDTTVRRWIKSGALEAVTLPHRGKRQAYRVKKSTMDKLLKSPNLPEYYPLKQKRSASTGISALELFISFSSKCLLFLHIIKK